MSAPRRPEGGPETTETCPCEFPEIERCHETCTCRDPYLSGGCRRCPKYGSREQRLAMARALTAALAPPALQATPFFPVTERDDTAPSAPQADGVNQ